MDKKDQEIKKALKHMQAPLSDPGFTDRVVAMHLFKKKQKSPEAYVDFGSLLTGMVAVLVSLLISYLNSVLQGGLSEDQVTVIQLLPVLYLVFQAMNEYFHINDPSRLKLNVAAKSLLIGVAYLGMTAL